MPKKNQANQCNYDELFKQLVTKILHCAVYQGAAVVGGDDLHPVRQALLQLLQFVLHRRDGFAGVLAAAQNYHAANYFTFAVEFGNAAAHLRA